MELFTVFVLTFFANNILLTRFVGMEGFLTSENMSFKSLFREIFILGVLFLLATALLWPLGEFLLFPFQLTYLWGIFIPFLSWGALLLYDAFSEKKDKEKKLNRLFSGSFLSGSLFLVFLEQGNFTLILARAFFGFLGILSVLSLLFFARKEFSRRPVMKIFKGAPVLLVFSAILSFFSGAFHHGTWGG